MGYRYDGPHAITLKFVVALLAPWTSSETVQNTIISVNATLYPTGILRDYIKPVNCKALRYTAATVSTNVRDRVIEKCTKEHLGPHADTPVIQTSS